MPRSPMLTRRACPAAGAFPQTQALRRDAASTAAPSATASAAHVRTAAALLAAFAMAGCATAPPPPPPPPPPPTYDQLMTSAQQAQTAGNAPQALDAWNAAAKQNPTAKEPWLHIAQLDFDAGNYGPAITAAQEALQRDANDTTANSLLAVSGLRVSSAALGRMRTDTIQGSTRSEAEQLAATLRDVLGEPVLVPAPAPHPAHPVRHVAKKPAAGTAATPAGEPAKPAAQPSADPFGSLR